mmetsp:Transcript_97557/g.119496  ORF Transcript_97557/g.119496 Transcript_97557/m.119496 type:complete len:222 (-) Transcript_97557:439-1104(-)
MSRPPNWSAFEGHGGVHLWTFLFRIGIRKAGRTLTFPYCLACGVIVIIETPSCHAICPIIRIVIDMSRWGKGGLQTQLWFGSSPRRGTMPETGVEQDDVSRFYPMLHDHVLIQLHSGKARHDDVGVPKHPSFEATLLAVHGFPGIVVRPFFFRHSSCIFALIDDLCASYTTLKDQRNCQSCQCRRQEFGWLVTHLTFGAIDVPSIGGIKLSSTDEISLKLS